MDTLMFIYFPFRYEDYSQLKKIEELKSGDIVTIKGKIELIANRRSFRKRKVLTEALINDETDSIKTLIGQSLGGLLATEILFKNPDLFDNYIIASPSLWWDDESLLKYSPNSYSTKKSIFIAVGKEGKVMERTAKELYDKLNLLKKENTNLYFEF